MRASVANLCGLASKYVRGSCNQGLGVLGPKPYGSAPYGVKIRGSRVPIETLSVLNVAATPERILTVWPPAYPGGQRGLCPR